MDMHAMNSEKVLDSLFHGIALSILSNVGSAILAEAWITRDCFVGRLFCGSTATWFTYIVTVRVTSSAKDEGQNFHSHLFANCILCPSYFVKKGGEKPTKYQFYTSSKK
jgi:hypothetical protein